MVSDGAKPIGGRRSIPLNVSTLEAEEIEAAKATLDSGFLTMGARCAEFERRFAAYVGSKHAIFVNSGSSANLIALFSAADPVRGARSPARIEPGSEVIVPALTWATTVWPVLQAGAIPVFVDCDPRTLQMQPEAVRAAIGPKTRGIVIVHVLGGAVDMPALRATADEHQLWLIEDSCEATGVRWQGRHVGGFGHIGTFSFYFAHHITTIEGGMVVTDDDYLADLLRAQRAHGWIKHMRNPEAFVSSDVDIDPRFLFVTSGFNVRPTEINGAIGIVQLARLEDFNTKRREVGRLLDQALAPLVEARKLNVMTHAPDCQPAPFGYALICADKAARVGLQRSLEEGGVETRPVICGNLARQPAMAHLPHRISGSLAGADHVMDCGLYFGSHPLMSGEDIDHIVAIIRRFYA